MRGWFLIWAAVACGGSAQRTPVGVPTDGGTVFPGEYEDPLVQASRLDGSRFIEILEVRARDDGRLFFCTGVRGLQVVDARDPERMVTVASLASSLGSSQFPRCQHLAWDGDLVYVTNRGDEIQPVSFVTAFDLGWSTPREVASLQATDAAFEGIAAADGRVYVAMHADGLAVIERRGDALERVGTATGLVHAWGVAARGRTAFVADGPGGLAVVDATDPAAPVVVGRVDTGGVAQHVVLDGDRAFVAAGARGLVVVDVADPTQPRVLGVANTPGTAVQVAVARGHAYVADWNDLRVFDVSDPSAPRLVATERIASGEAFPRVLGVGAAGDVVFAGEWTGLYAYRSFPDRVAPDLFLSERAIERGGLAPGEVDRFPLELTNDGTAPLVAWAIETEGGAFAVDTPQAVLPPGASRVVEVRFQPSALGVARGALVIRSDDPDEPTRRVPLVVNRPGIGPGDPAPEVTVSLLGGGVWRLSEQRGSIVLLAYFATF